MKRATVKITGKKLEVSHPLLNCEIKPTLNPKVYPLFCVELVAERISNLMNLNKYTIEHLDSDSWEIIF